MKRWLPALLLGLGLVGTPASAPAWDPSTTHQGLLETAVRRAAVHRRWMDASELQRGIFSPVRVDPNLLTPDERRIIKRAIANAHADSGARPLGGPGACPPADSPPDTQIYCVQGDLWELDALGWMRLGIVAEATPPARLSHHFIDGKDPNAKTWRDAAVRGARTREHQTRNGAPLAGEVAGSSFDGSGESAIAWLADQNDPLAPRRLEHHLAQASLAKTRGEREHHLALALVCTGALLHVVQDLTVPAHARGDAGAFDSALSLAPGDRGLPFQEFVRSDFGRREIPTGAPPSKDARGEALAPSLREHLLGTKEREGAAEFARSRFFSERTLPEPKVLASDLDPKAAAAQLLGSEHGLLDVEVAGATLTPWPAARGYLRTSTGRALAAFTRDESGETRLYLDTFVYRDQAAALLPLAVETSRSILDLLWPEWSAPSASAAGRVIEFEVPDGVADAELLVLEEDERGGRTVSHRAELDEARRQRIVGLPAPAPATRRVLVLRGVRPDGSLWLRERMLPGDAPAPAPALPSVAPPPQPSASEKPEEFDPDAPAAGEPEPTPETAAPSDDEAEPPPQNLAEPYVLARKARCTSSRPMCRG